MPQNPTHEELRAAGAEYARNARVEQGLPEYVEDPVVLRKIAVLAGLIKP